MRSIKFPNMFNTNNTRVWKENEYNSATIQNTITLLLSERGELIGDPYYGVKLKQYLFDQHDRVLEDYLIDTIYTQIALFIPQVRIKRSDIQLIPDKTLGKIHLKFTGVSQIDYTVNTYNLLIFQSSVAE